MESFDVVLGTHILSQSRLLHVLDRGGPVVPVQIVSVFHTFVHDMPFKPQVKQGRFQVALLFERLSVQVGIGTAGTGTLVLTSGHRFLVLRKVLRLLQLRKVLGSHDYE